MEQMVSSNFKQFLQENGYEWSGYIAQNINSRYEKFENGGKFVSSLDELYILLGSPFIWDEDEGIVKVIDDPLVKYIEHDDIMFRVYKKNRDGKLELEKDLSAEWVRYKAENIEGYYEEELKIVKHIQEHYPKRIECRKNLLAQEIERITSEANISIKSMEETIYKSKMVEEVLNQVQQERLIKKQIELGAKDNFKDTTGNDACLQHLIDTFGIGK